MSWRVASAPEPLIAFCQGIHEKKLAHLPNADDRMPKLNPLRQLEGTEQVELIWALLENSSDALFLMDAGGSIRLANRAAETLFGQANSDLEGINAQQLFAKPSGEQLSKEIRRLTEDAKPAEFGSELELQALRTDGSKFWARVVAKALPFGSLPGVSISMHDLSEHKRALESEAKFRALVESAPICIHEIDLQGRLISMNPAGLAMVDSTIEKICDLEYLSFVGEQSRANTQELLAQAFEGKTSFFEFDCETPDGQHIFSSCFVPIRDEAGRVTRLMGLTEDITARLRAEEQRARVEQQMLHSQKLESLGVLSGGIAHDFNNLLMGVLGNASVALEDARTPSVRTCLQDIESTAMRAAELCRQLLAYAGKGKFEVRSLDISAIIEEMGQILTVSIAKSIVLRYELAENLPAVEVDAAQMRQIIMNLIINASDAIGDRSGTISIRSGCMYLDEDYLLTAFTGENIHPGSYVFFEVTDTGCGMDPKAQAQMFDPFFTTKSTGRGLGLAATLVALFALTKERSRATPNSVEARPSRSCYRLAPWKPNRSPRQPLENRACAAKAWCW